MAIIRWRPWNLLDDIADLRREMEQMLGRWQVDDGRSFLPATDIVTKDKDVVIKMELPGLDPEKDLDIKVDGGALVVSGRREKEREVSEADYHLRERSYGSFYRRFPLPEGVSADAISATYNDGVLEVTLAGAARITQGESKRIEVKSGKEAKRIEAKAA